MRRIGVTALLGTVLVTAGLALEAAEDALVKSRPVSEWVEQLRDENRGSQMRAARALAEAPESARPTVVAHLIPVLESDRENDRFVAAQVLGECGAQARAAVPKLVLLLKGTQFERNRAAAAKALGLILKDAEPSEEVGKVAEALAAKFNEDSDKYSDVRREAVRAIGMIGPAAKGVIPKLTKALTEPGGTPDSESGLVRRQAAWTCGRMGPLAAEHIDQLISMLHVKFFFFMPEIPEAIGLVGAVHENVAPNLLDAYEASGGIDASIEYKLAIMGALARLGPDAKPAVEVIRRLFRESARSRRPYVELRTEWVRVLGAIGPAAKEALPDIEAQLAYQGAPVSKDKAESEALYRTLHEEAAKAYKAVTGREPPAGGK